MLETTTNIITRQFKGIIVKGYYNKNSRFVFHCENGPAVILEGGTLFWYFHGILHNECGPAIIWYHGDVEYCKHGVKYTWDDIG